MTKPAQASHRSPKRAELPKMLKSLSTKQPRVSPNWSKGRRQRQRPEAEAGNSGRRQMPEVDVKAMKAMKTVKPMKAVRRSAMKAMRAVKPIKAVDAMKAVKQMKVR